MAYSNHLHQAYLYIGTPEKLRVQAQVLIKSVLCSRNSCNLCVSCRQIGERQHHAVRWFNPEAGYTVAHLEQIFTTISFSLDDSQHLFFVLERAESLSTACANSLLKILEEPPRGYHFILLASSKEGVLPTISSRCIIYHLDQEPHEHHPLLDYFIDRDVNKALDFAKEIEKLKIAERDVPLFLDALDAMILKHYSQALSHADQEKLSLLIKQKELVDKARAYLPMPGSSKLFFKNLFLQFLIL